MKFLLLLSLVISFSVSAKTPEAKGMRLAKKAEAANNGFVSEKSTMEMILIDAHGSRIKREMKGLVLEVKKDGDKSLMTFLNPRDVKGTKMLTWSHKGSDDKQWLYLPSMKRVRKISSSSKTSSFMGSEFSFEDLGSQEVSKYKFKFIEDAKLAGQKIWVSDRFPKSKSGYSKQRIYTSVKYMNPLKVEYFDKRGGLLKVAMFKGYKAYKVNGKNIYRASSIHIKNVQTKKESIFSWKNRTIGAKLKSSMFKKSALKR